MNTTAPSLTTPAHTPIPEIVSALERVGPLQGLERKEYEWLATHGTERFASRGMILFEDGEEANSMNIILKGEIQVQRRKGGPHALFIGRAGQITGLLPY